MAEDKLLVVSERILGASDPFSDHNTLRVFPENQPEGAAA